MSDEHPANAAGERRAGQPKLVDASRPPLAVDRSAHSRRGDAGCEPSDRTDAEAVALRSKAKASSILCGQRAGLPPRVSAIPLGFVTPSPAGRRGNRYGRRFSPSPFGRIPRATKSPAAAVLR